MCLTSFTLFNPQKTNQLKQKKPYEVDLLLTHFY